MALNGSSPRFLQDELFGGDFLRNAGALNFSGAVGDRGALSLDRLSPQNPRLQQNQNLVRFISKAMEDPAFFSVLKNTLMSSSSSASLYQVQQSPVYQQIWAPFLSELWLTSTFLLLFCRF